jgi:sugar lactone lactonase YvrE
MKGETTMRRVQIVFVLVLGLILLLATTTLAAPSNVFPKTIPLPDGWRPEGITSGSGTDFYVGSLANGAIYKGDFRTGEGDVLVPGAQGRVTVGLWFDARSGYLFAAGGNTGMGHVFDTRTGELVQSLTLATGPSFINDVVVTQDAAYFTNSQQAVFYRAPLSANGRLPDSSPVQTIPLGGDWAQVTGFNANGIDATPNGKTLIIVNSTTGLLYLVDPNSGDATEIDLGGDTVTMGDGILLDGKSLYVIRNRANEIVVIDLSPDLSSGEVVNTITDPAFDVPTTIAEFGKRLYAVNARFNTPPQPDTEYQVVQVRQAKR